MNVVSAHIDVSELKRQHQQGRAHPHLRHWSRPLGFSLRRRARSTDPGGRYTLAFFFTHRTDEYLQPICILSSRCDRLCTICTENIESKKQAIRHVDYTASTPQHELNHTDQEYICPERARSWKGESMICLPEV